MPTDRRYGTMFGVTFMAIYTGVCQSYPAAYNYAPPSPGTTNCTPDNYLPPVTGICVSTAQLDSQCSNFEISSSAVDCSAFDGHWCCYTPVPEATYPSYSAVPPPQPTTMPSAYRNAYQSIHPVQQTTSSTTTTYSAPYPTAPPFTMWRTMSPLYMPMAPTATTPYFSSTPAYPATTKQPVATVPTSTAGYYPAAPTAGYSGQPSSTASYPTPSGYAPYLVYPMNGMTGNSVLLPIAMAVAGVDGSISDDRMSTIQALLNSEPIRRSSFFCSFLKIMGVKVNESSPQCHGQTVKLSERGKSPTSNTVQHDDQSEDVDSA